MSVSAHDSGRCPTGAALHRLVEEDLADEERSALSRHVERCAACRKSLEAIRVIGSSLAISPGECEEPTLADDVLCLVRVDERAQSALPSRSWLRAWCWLVPLVVGASVGVVLIAVVPQTDDGAFHARGGSVTQEAADALDLRVFRRRGDSYTPVQEAINGDDALAFAFANPVPGEYSYLAIFAVQDDGRVFWFHPAHLDANADPGSVPVCSGCGVTPLPDEVRHDLAPGDLRIFGLFSKEPLSVSAVERRLASRLALLEPTHQRLVAALRSLALNGTAERSLLVTVRAPGGRPR